MEYLEDLRAWVPVFSGDQSLSLDAYQQKVHSYCTFYNLSTSKEQLLAEHRCVGAAAAPLSGKSFTSISELRQALQGAVGRSEEEAFEELCRVKQHPSELVTTYADRLRLAFERTSVSGASFILRNVFLQGLQPNLQPQVCQLAPESFEEAIAKAKLFEAEQCHVYPTESPAWDCPLQDTVAPVRRPRSARQPQQDPSAPAARSQPPRAQHPPSTPQAAAQQHSYQAATLCAELTSTTEQLQELLAAYEASQGSAVVGDPTAAPPAASQLFILDTPPAPPSLLQSFSTVAFCLYSSLDEARHQRDLPRATIAQLEHCSDLFQGLAATYLSSSQGPQSQACLYDFSAQQEPAETPLTLRDSPSAAEPCEPAQPAVQPCQPAVSPPATDEPHTEVFNSVQQVPVLPSDQKFMSSSMEDKLPLLETDTPAIF